MPAGRTRRTASATFSGFNPPARMTSWSRASLAAAVPVDDAAGAAVADGVVRVEQQRRAGPLRDLRLGVRRSQRNGLDHARLETAHEVRRFGSVELHGIKTGLIHGARQFRGRRVDEDADFQHGRRHQPTDRPGGLESERVVGSRARR